VHYIGKSGICHLPYAYIFERREQKFILISRLKAVVGESSKKGGNHPRERRQPPPHSVLFATRV
jgi:hypothetical protein